MLHIEVSVTALWMLYNITSSGQSNALPALDGTPKGGIPARTRASSYIRLSVVFMDPAAADGCVSTQILRAGSDDVLTFTSGLNNDGKVGSCCRGNIGEADVV